MRNILGKNGRYISNLCEIEPLGGWHRISCSPFLKFKVRGRYLPFYPRIRYHLFDFLDLDLDF